MKFLLGCNYWDSAHGTDMWKCYDPDVIEKDIEALSKSGIQCMRVFPNWRDFQPVKRLYAWRGKPCDVVTVDEEPLQDDTGIDSKQIANFRHFALTCHKYGISLVVSVVTGWMSGRLFVPPILDGRNMINDPEALMWTDRFIRGFVSQVKDLPNIVMWDLGNECNCLGPTTSRAEAYTWTAFVRNAIKAADPTRLISSGMHGLDGDEAGVWTMSDQGELTDYMTTHPYISPTINNDLDPANQMRSTIFPTAQSMFYQDLGKKPVIMQEQGGFTVTTANNDAAADFARVNIYSSFAHNVHGYFWWCGCEHIHLETPPYIWSMMERSLGLLDENREPKPVGKAIAEAAKVLGELPFEELPPHQIDAVCVLTENDRWNNASSSFVLAKQAGLNMQFCPGNVRNINLPDAPMYIVPGVWKWAIMYKHSWDILKKKVHDDGAVMLVTYDGGSLIEMEEIFGLCPHGNIKTQGSHTAKFAFGELPYSVTYELMLESVGAKVLAVNETGNPVFTEHDYGNGKVFFLNMPLELNLSSKAGAFTDTDWYKIYKRAGEKVLDTQPIRSENPQIGLTLHKVSDEKYIVCAINYSDKTQSTDFCLKEGWTLEPIRGEVNQVYKCDIALYYINIKK